jgi:hypothetical protein
MYESKEVKSIASIYGDHGTLTLLTSHPFVPYITTLLHSLLEFSISL